MAGFIFLIVPIFGSLVALMFIEDPEWQARRNITHLAKESLKREQHPKPQRGCRYIHAGYSVKRR